MFLVLVGWHALADYPLQGDFMARAKNPFAPVPGVPWATILASHSAIHGLGVGIITGSAWLGLAEMAAHSLIDASKCKGLIGFNTDQWLHVACKAVWIALIVNGVDA